MKRTLVLLPLLLAPPLSPGVSAQTTASHLFLDHEPLVLRLETDLHALTHDRGNQRTAHPGTLQYGSGSDTGSLAVKLRTRGIFRLKTCGFPPIRLDLPSHKVDGTPFAGEDRLKLVTHCQKDHMSEHNLLREYALYRVLNAVTDTSFRVRLAHMTYVDSVRNDTVIRYGFLIESDTALAQRIGATPVRGNNDWSVWGRHNIAIFQLSADPRPLLGVPYDFDFSGAVNAPYASPPPQVPVKTVRERWYRGYCQPDSVLLGAIARFRAAKDSIYTNVRAVPDLPEGDVRNMLQYFDDFYKVIDNRGALNREFVRNCRTLHLNQ